MSGTAQSPHAARPGDINFQTAPLELDTIGGIDRTLRTLVFHLHKGEAAGLSGIAIIDQFDRFHVTVFGKQLPDLV